MYNPKLRSVENLLCAWNKLLTTIILILCREPVRVCNACYKKHSVKSTSRASEVINTLEESMASAPSTTHDHLHQSPHPTQCPAPTPLPHPACREHQQPPEDPPLPELRRSCLGGGGGVNGRHPHAPTSSLRLLHPRPAQLRPKLLYRPAHWKAQ